MRRFHVKANQYKRVSHTISLRSPNTVHDNSRTTSPSDEAYRRFDSAEEELRIYTQVMEAINKAATCIVNASRDAFDQAVNESLRIIGTAVHVDRTYIWENFETNGKLYCRQSYEWSEHVEAQQNKDFTQAIAYDDLPFWRTLIETKTTFNGPVSTLHPAKKDILEQQGIRSMLLIPLHVENTAWGFIGFDDCHKDRYFSNVKAQVLESVGILIASLILRNKTTQRTIDAWIEVMDHERLLHAVNDVARLLLSDDPDDFKRTVQQALKTLGGFSGADRVSIWRNFINEDGHTNSRRLALYDTNESYAEYQSIDVVDCEIYEPGWYTSRHDINRTANHFHPRSLHTELFLNCASLLLLPLNIHGNFWGFIAFFHTRAPYVYNEKQMSILRSGGMLIASGIGRDELLKSLVEARENALASARSKSEFLSRMSHEIRTPMNAIIGMTTLAKKSGDITKVWHYLETVNASSKQLLDIINDVLDMSKIEANRLEIENRPFDIEDMIRHAIHVVQLKLNEKKQELRLDMPHTFPRALISDELRLSQVLINLFSNAAKFTPEGGSITLSVLEMSTNPSMLRFQVTDTGVGIQPSQLTHVFDSFEQGDGSITRQYGGTGLGLAICKKIVELMHGTIHVDSVVGEFSRFTVDIRVEWGAELTNTRTKRSLQEGLRVLVVDDAPEVLTYFNNLLPQFKLICDTASNGTEAVQRVTACMAEHTPYDMVLLDWFMPGMNSGEIADQIRRIMGDCVMVLLIAATEWIDIEKEALQWGLTRYITKPVLPSELYNKLIELTDASVLRKANNPVTTEGADLPEASEADTDYNWRGQYILLAEDIDINREIIMGILEDTGVTIDCAADGRQAVDIYKANPNRYRLILMDVQMPVLDGLNATREIRASGMPDAQKIPIIAMTAHAFKEDEKASLDAGMNGHLAKPVDMAALMAVVSEAMR